MCVGQYFVEDEQQAQYGQAVLKNLSACLTNKYGQGWSVETLKKMSDEPNRNSPHIGQYMLRANQSSVNTLAI